MSLLLATTLLALGGLGIYMYKNSDESQKGGDEEYNEEGLFDSTNFWGYTDDQKDDDNEEEEEVKPRKRGGKTQRNRKSTGTSRRRY